MPQDDDGGPPAVALAPDAESAPNRALPDPAHRQRHRPRQQSPTTAPTTLIARAGREDVLVPRSEATDDAAGVPLLLTPSEVLTVTVRGRVEIAGYPASALVIEGRRCVRQSPSGRPDEHRRRRTAALALTPRANAGPRRTPDGRPADHRPGYCGRVSPLIELVTAAGELIYALQLDVRDLEEPPNPTSLRHRLPHFHPGSTSSPPHRYPAGPVA